MRSAAESRPCRAAPRRSRGAGHARGLGLAALLVFASGACGSGPAVEVAPPGAPRPDIVLVSIDTLRADHVGVYGYPRPTTPAIDAFARDAVVFRSCVAHAPTTLASHASLLTSLLPIHHGASISNRTRLAESASPLAEVLAGHGYRTASFNGGIQLAALWGLDRGFEVYESVQPQSASPDALAGPENRLAESVARARSWLEQVDEPFFLFLHSYEIHHPYTPEPRHLAFFEEAYAGPLRSQISVRMLERINAGAIELDAADRQHVVNVYDAELRSADEAFGELIAMLKARGLYENALIVLTSDHGEEFGEHGKMGWHSHTLYDELLLVPLIVKLPGGAHAGRVVESPVRGVDLAPTLLGVAGVPVPSSYAGDDLQSLMATGEGARPAAVSVMDAEERPAPASIRRADWKLHLDGGRRLFALDEDPQEQRDRSQQQPAIAAELVAELSLQLDSRAEPDPLPALPDVGLLEQLRSLGYIE